MSFSTMTKSTSRSHESETGAPTSSLRTPALRRDRAVDGDAGDKNDGSIAEVAIERRGGDNREHVSVVSPTKDIKPARKTRAYRGKKTEERHDGNQDMSSSANEAISITDTSATTTRVEEDSNLKRAEIRRGRINKRSNQANQNAECSKKTKSAMDEKREAHRRERIIRNAGQQIEEDDDDDERLLDNQEVIDDIEKEASGDDSDQHGDDEYDRPGAFPVGGPNLPTSHSIVVTNNVEAYLDSPVPDIASSGIRSTSDEDNVVADIVEEAELIQYAEEAKFLDFLEKFRCTICVGSIALIVAILFLFGVLVRMGGSTFDGDPRCLFPEEQMTIPFRCYCFGYVNQPLTTSEQEQKYLFVLNILQRSNVIHSDWTIPINALKYLDDDYDDIGGDFHNSTNIDTIDYCEPINQVLYQISLMDNEIMVMPYDSIVDLFVLSYMYITMGGINWTRTDGWFEEGDICNWYGVDCQFELLFTLELSYNNLAGTIPDVIRHLGSLRMFDLSINQGIVGTISSSLTEMTSLNLLDLSNCSLTGKCAASVEWDCQFNNF